MFDKQIFLSGITNALYENKDECTKVDVVKKFIFAVKSALDTDAVAMRLFEVADFPFYTTVGFTDVFIEAEKYLCPHALKGVHPDKWPKDSCLECVCGSVVKGKPIANIGNTSGNGSFWTSNASDVKNMTCPDGKIKLRGTCLENGYESICITQIKNDDQIIGILQINDRSKGMFDEEIVSIIEGVCICLGSVLGPLINQEMDEEEKEKIFLDNMIKISNDIRDRINAL